MINSLYIHIPFCSRICTYCDFYKMVAKDEVKDKYIDYLIKELEMKRKYLQDLRTIYIGGGTPSSLTLANLEKLLTYLNQFIKPATLKEFTFEANPNDVTLELMNVLKKYHVDRISLGVQSLDPEKLKVLGRSHTEEDVRRSLRIIKSVGIKKINVDIIYGVNGDTWQKIKYDLKKVIKFGAKHISTYSLILEDKTILMKLYNEGKFNLYNEDLEQVLYNKIIKYLRHKGFNHYEISNFAKKNQQSHHNLVYWDNMNYIGAGAGASYYIDNIRYTNIKNLDKYYKGIDDKNLNYSEVVTLTKEEIMSEELMMGLRKTKGVNIKNFKEKFGLSIYEAFPIISKLMKMHVLKFKDDYLFIPENKLYLSNEVLVNFI